jgi:hypothetical protein
MTNLMHKFVFYNKFITVLYMFRAPSCSSSGGQVVLIQHLVSSLSVSDRLVHWLRKNSQRASQYNLSKWPTPRTNSLFYSKFFRDLFGNVDVLGSSLTLETSCTCWHFALSFFHSPLKFFSIFSSYVARVTFCIISYSSFTNSFICHIIWCCY